MSYRVYAFGSNGSGQLGIGSTDDVSVPTECKFEPELSDMVPTSIASGGNHTLISCEGSIVYATGENEDGRCGMGYNQPSSEIFKPVAFRRPSGEKVEQIRHIAATWQASCFVVQHIDPHQETSIGDVLQQKKFQVYTCGTGSKGELGQGEGVTESKTPKALTGFPPDSTEITDITSSMGHVVVVLSNGQAWGWGNGRKGQIGDPATIVWKPRKIEGIPFKASRAICGRDFTLILGLPSTTSFKFIGTNKVPIAESLPCSLSSQDTIAASWSGVYIVRNSQMWSAGRNEYGQLAPTGLPPVAPVLAAGSEHILAKDTSGAVLAWGWGEHGNCGPLLEADKTVHRPWNIVPYRGEVHAVGAGCATSFIITQKP